MKEKDNYTKQEVEEILLAYHEYVEMNNKEGNYYNKMMEMMLEDLPSRRKAAEDFNNKLKEIKSKIPKSLISKLEIEETLEIFKK